MLIPLIVIGVLFLITWIVIGVSGTSVPYEAGHDSHDHCPSDWVDPYHKCSYTSLHREIERLKTETGSLRSRLRDLEFKLRYEHPLYETPVKSPEQLLKELVANQELPTPKEFKVEGTLKVVK